MLKLEEIIAIVVVISLLIILLSIWLYTKRKRANRPIKIPTRRQASQIRPNLSVDVDTSELTMPSETSPEGEPYYLVIDTETYNPISREEDELILINQADNNPPIALSWQVLDEQGYLLEEASFILKQNQDEELKPEAVEIHGINQLMLQEGLEPQKAYLQLSKTLGSIKCIVGHNLAFHLSTILQDAERHHSSQLEQAFSTKDQICTMLWGKSLGFKTWRGGEPLYPRLDELFGYLYFKRMHIPLYYKSKTLRDVRLCAACLRYKLSRPI